LANIDIGSAKPKQQAVVVSADQNEKEKKQPRDKSKFKMSNKKA